MERRGQERDLRIPNYTPQQIIQESPMKLPLAPILSTPPDRLIRGNAMASTRRGSSIFSPTQTLDPPQHHQHLSPPPPPVQAEPTSDPDPHTQKTAAASNSNTPPAPPPPPQAAADATTSNTTIRYRECLKNHAASMGGHVVDGCGEFMPGGEEGLEALRCAACDCHRNFHRKEISGGTQQSRYNNSNRQSPLVPSQTPTAHHKRSHSALASSGRGPTPPTMVNFAGEAAETSSEHPNNQPGSGFGHAAEQPSKKRFRTKFSQDQKDRMHEFASKIGWRMQKQDDEELKQFCSEVGVQRQAFKVWMHNIKQATKKNKESDHDHHTT